MEEITKDIMIESPETLSKVFGKYDENIKLIEGRLKVDVLVCATVRSKSAARAGG